MMKAKFIVIEGIEGAGKSTVIKHIADFLSEQNIKYILTREPGGTELAEGIRELIKQDYNEEKVFPETEVLLLYAARLQLVENIIKPALNNNTWVIADRHDLSTLAYQAGGRGVNESFIKNIKQATLKEFSYDFCLFLDVDPALGLKRASGRGKLDRIERENLQFFAKVRSKYLELLSSFSKNGVIDANQDQDKVIDDAVRSIKEQITE